jgi:4-hydroxybenzoate polyprenyltransferase
MSTAAGAAPGLPGAMPTLDEFLRLAPEEMVAVARSSASRPVPAATRLRVLFHLSRPRTWPASLLTYALGAHFAGADLSWRVVVGGVVSMLIVLAANVLNAFSDLDEDARNLPGRVYLVAQLGYASLFRVGLATTALLFVLGASVSGAFFVTVLFAALGLAQYSFPPVRAKERPILGLLVFAQALGFPLILGWYAASDSAAGLDRELLGMWVFLTVLWIAKGMFKNVPDFYGDVAAGITTSATVFGSWRRAAIVAAGGTFLAYGLYAAEVAAGYLPGRAALALVWLPVSLWSCRRLIEVDDPAAGNAVLKLDMIISCCLLASIVLLVAPTPTTALAAGVSVLLFLLADLFRLDSRRNQDVIGRPE